MKAAISTVLAFTFIAVLPWASARTQEKQQSMTPQEVLDELMEGNARFASGHATQRNLLIEAAQTAGGQYPIAAVVSCIDSRVPVEIVFDQGIGDVFVGRVAGNVEDRDMVGSLEFATKLAGSKLILVMGHEACGAIKGAIAGAELGNLTQLLTKIQPAMNDVSGITPRTVNNPEFVDAVTAANVLRTINDIRTLSPTLVEMEKSGDIMIVGAMYDLNTGRVKLLDPEKMDDHDDDDDDHDHDHDHDDFRAHRPQTASRLPVGRRIF